MKIPHDDFFHININICKICGLHTSKARRRISSGIGLYLLSSSTSVITGRNFSNRMYPVGSSSSTWTVSKKQPPIHSANVSEQLLFPSTVPSTGDLIIGNISCKDGLDKGQK